MSWASFLKFVGAGDEVGLAAKLDHGPDPSSGMEIGLDDTFVGSPAHAFGHAGYTLFTKG